MTLYLDIRRDAVTVAAVGPRDARWLALTGDNMIGRALDRAKKAFGFARKKPDCVVVAMNAAAATPETRNVSWSGVRQGVATANALAFAWSVPVAQIAVTGTETREEVAALVRQAAKAARSAKKSGVWIKAAYDGEPNITKPKTS